MELKEQLYGYAAKVDRQLKRILDSKNISKNNKKRISMYVRHCEAKGLSPARRLIILQRLYKLGEMVGKTDFYTVSKGDMEEVMIKVNKLGYSPHSVSTLVSVMKTFWRHMHDLTSSDSLPASIKWIKSSNPGSSLRKEELVTIGEMKQLQDATPEVMWKCLLSTLYESCCRPGEITNLKYGDVHVTDQYIKLNVKGKMENKQGERSAYLVERYNLMSQWLDTHPTKKKDSPLWLVRKRVKVSKKGEKTKYEMQYVPVSTIMLNYKIQQAKKQTGITKRIYPYLLRHSRGTILYSKLGEAKAKRLMGHARDSRMAKFYNHLDDSDILPDLLGGEVKPELRDKKCQRCNHTNPYTASKCVVCSIPFDIKALVPQEDLIKQAVVDVLKQLGYSGGKVKSI